jgi:anti-anti-sigma factor
MTTNNHTIPVVALTGEVDLMRAPDVLKQLLAAADNRDVGLVVDLSDATYIDSAAVNVLFQVAEGLASRQVILAVVVPDGGLVERVVKLVDLASVARMHQNVQSAIADIESSA